MRKIFFIIISIILCIVFLTGCWDNKELNAIGIVLAVGIEKEVKTGEIICTVEVVKPVTLKKNSGSEESTTQLITGRGNTIAEATRDIYTHIDRRLIFSHNKVIIIDEDIAREGVLPILDFFMRRYEIRQVDKMIVAKGKKVREILSTGGGISNIQGIYLEGIINNSKLTTRATTVNLMVFMKRLLSEGINPVTGVMKEVKNFDGDDISNNQVKYSEVAVFKSDKLVGYLDEKETRGFNWITNNSKAGIININSTKNHKELVSTYIKTSKSKIKPEINDEKIIFNIEIKESGDIADLPGLIDASDTKVIETLENELKKVIEVEVKMALNKTQKILNSDVIGFGRSLKENYPKVWENVKEDWDKIFPNVEYNVKVDVKFEKPGLIFKKFEPKE